MKDKIKIISKAKEVDIFVLNDEGSTSSRSISMSGEKISGLGDPKDPGDAVPYSYMAKNYSDTTSGTIKFLETKGGTMTGPLNMGGFKLYGIKDPQNDNHAANIRHLKAKAHEITTNENINDLTDDGSAVINRISSIEQVIGFEAQETIDSNGNVTTNYVVTGGSYIATSGGTMTGHLDMGSNKVTNVSDTPIEDGDGVNKNYLEKNILISAPSTGSGTGTPTQTTRKLIGDLDLGEHTVQQLESNHTSQSDKKNAANVKAVREALTNYVHPFLSYNFDSSTTSTPPSTNTPLTIEDKLSWKDSNSSGKECKNSSADRFFTLEESPIKVPSNYTIQNPISFLKILNRGLYYLSWSGEIREPTPFPDNIILSLVLVNEIDKVITEKTLFSQHLLESVVNILCPIYIEHEPEGTLGVELRFSKIIPVLPAENQPSSGGSTSGSTTGGGQTSTPAVPIQPIPVTLKLSQSFWQISAFNS